MSYAKQKVLQTEGKSYPLEKFFQVMKSAEIMILISQKKEHKNGFMLFPAIYIGCFLPSKALLRP